ncbi:acetylxylan esterase [Candidatus Bathyarchaeota archaeon]|nr:acetylxylan esterase [Candidatus Bathyarchaeota archaeon]
MNIFAYLCREARKITDNSLKEPMDFEELSKTRNERLRSFLEMLGLEAYSMKTDERPPVEAKETGTIERNGYKIEKLFFESLPKLYVTGNLYIPRPRESSSPAILYLCGHSQNQKHHYQAHARKFAELGFVVLLIETIQRGEIRGHHHGVYHYGFFQWYSRGYTPAGVEVWNAIRAIDLLHSRKEVEPGKIGVTGISGGGAISWYTGAADERVKAIAPVCGTATIASHVCKHTIEGHCDCMFWINTHMWDLTDVGALIAPRPLLIASALRDWIFDIDSVRLIYGKLKRLYEAFGVPENIALVETPGGHSYHTISRRRIFQWFLKHLKGIEASLEEIGDIDESPEVQESPEALRVFQASIPKDEKVTTVHEWFVRKVEPPEIEGPKDLEAHRKRLVKTLLEKTFAAFPRKPCDLDVEIELVQESGKWLGYLVGFTPEEGWRLHMHVLKPIDERGSSTLPLLLFLARNARNLYFGDGLLANFGASWARAFVELRGIGETSWGQDIQWLLRRAAMLTGRTLASIKVYDCLRAIEALSSLGWIDKERIALMGCGEGAVTALYAALLKGGLASVILYDPPPTQDAPSNPDGTGMAIEMLNCLKYTDLPYVAGLLWPTPLVFLGPRPQTYQWAEELYKRLGPPGFVAHLKDLSQGILCCDKIG